jgi:hypothetical protein
MFNGRHWMAPDSTWPSPTVDALSAYNRLNARSFTALSIPHHFLLAGKGLLSAGYITGEGCKAQMFAFTLTTLET